MTNSYLRKELSSKDVGLFARYYLGHHAQTKLGDLHKDWIGWMQKKRVALAAPREHAKSTWFSLIYPLWCILYEKKKFIVLISDSASQAEDFLGAITQELETNELIIEDFGRIAGYIPPRAEEKSKWNAKEINTTTGITVIARGWKSKLRGIRKGADRPDLIIIDDIENDENVKSEDQRRKVEAVFRRSILNLGSKSTQIIMIGTILHYDSLLHNILKNPPPKWQTRLYRAIEEGQPLWHEWWSMERLEERREEIGNIEFEQEFMNNPLDPSQQILIPQEYYEGNIDTTMMDFFGYIDLAISEKQTADYTAIVTIGRHRNTGKLYVIEPVRIRGDISKQLELVFQFHKKYNYQLFGVESVAYQKAFAQILKLESQKRNIYVPTKEIEVDKDKVRRAIEITPHIDNGTILFNNNYQDFMAEIQQFPKSAHDDFVDAFCGAVKLALGNGVKMKVYTGGHMQYPK